MKTKIKLQNCQIPDHYETDLKKLNQVLHGWMGHKWNDHDSARAEGLRYYSKGSERAGVWLCSNELEIAVRTRKHGSVEGVKIVADYDVQYLTSAYERNNHHWTMMQIEQTLMHIQLVKDACPDINVWPPEVWNLWPRAESIDNLLIPF